MAANPAGRHLRRGGLAARGQVEAMEAHESPAFGEVLRHYRVAAGLTQAELAERAGLSERGVSDLERGLKHRPHKDTVRLLATALGLAGTTRAAFEAARGRSTGSADANGRAVGGAPSQASAYPAGWVDSNAGRSHPAASRHGSYQPAACPHQLRRAAHASWPPCDASSARRAC